MCDLRIGADCWGRLAGCAVSPDAPSSKPEGLIIMRTFSLRTITLRTAGAWTTVLLGLAVAAGCQTAPPRNTELMKAAGATEISASELRVRLNDYAGRFARTVEGAADSIANAADGNRPVMVEAHDWKMVAIPTGLRAIFQTDPMAGLLDIWVATVQQRHWIESGGNRPRGVPGRELSECSGPGARVRAGEPGRR